MKAAKSLIEMAAALEELKANAKDFMVPVTELKPVTTETHVNLQFGDKTFTPNSVAHKQLSAFTEIPRQYYDRILKQNPALLSENIRHGLKQKAHSKEDGRRMIRTVGDQARAILSDKYRRLDAYDLMQAILPVMHDGRFEVDSCELTESRVYLKALTSRVKSEVKPGDAVQYGLMVSSSDVGDGALRVEPLIFRLVCKNGAVMSSAIRKMHLGRNFAGEGIQELLSDRTKELSDAAFWNQVRDVVQAHMDPAIFEREVEKLREAAGQPIKNTDIQTVIELAMEKTGIQGEGLLSSMVAYMANGADGAGFNRWGLANAFTYAAQGEEVSYDKSVDLERAGGRILELHRAEWTKIAEAA